MTTHHPVRRARGHRRLGGRDDDDDARAVLVLELGVVLVERRRRHDAVARAPGPVAADGAAAAAPSAAGAIGARGVPAEGARAVRTTTLSALAAVPVSRSSGRVAGDPRGLDPGHQWPERREARADDAAGQLADGPARRGHVVEGEVGALLEIGEADERDGAGALGGGI